MNANELADELWNWEESLFREAATMLRQQQAEIEALKNRNWDLVSEPWGFDRHPAKTLTDEEIDAVGDEVSNLIDTYAGRREFARAILRKAQEK
jgi:hypothetical protein